MRDGVVEATIEATATPETMYRKLLQVLIGGLTMVLLVGCAANPAEVASSPYSSEIEVAKNKANDFELAILEDGVITDSEYLEAQQKFVSCVNAQGLNVTAKGFGEGYDLVADLGSPATMEVFNDCGVGTINIIEPLFYGLRDNPQKLDMSEVYAACFVRVGAAPAGFTGKDLIAIWNADEPSQDTVIDEGSESGQGWIEMNPSEVHSSQSQVIPQGKAMDSPEVLECLINPQGK